MLPLETIRKILEGGESVCAQPASRLPAAIRSIRSSRSTGWWPLVWSIRQPQAQTGARPGDKLILGKGLGVGVYSAAFKKDVLIASGLRSDDRHHDPAQHAGAGAGCLDGVHALTDVTGFGLLGHLLEICKGSKVARVDSRLCRCSRMRWNGKRGLCDRRVARNWGSYGSE